MRLWSVEPENCDYEQVEQIVVFASSPEDAFNEACWWFVTDTVEFGELLEFTIGYGDQGDITVSAVELTGKTEIISIEKMA